MSQTATKAAAREASAALQALTEASATAFAAEATAVSARAAAVAAKTAAVAARDTATTAWEYARAAESRSAAAEEECSAKCAAFQAILAKKHVLGAANVSVAAKAAAAVNDVGAASGSTPPAQAQAPVVTGAAGSAFRVT